MKMLRSLLSACKAIMAHTSHVSACKVILPLSSHLSVLILILSCTDPGLCYEANHPHTNAGVYIAYEWPDAQRPASVDSMQVLAVRAINHRKYGIIISVDSLRGHYFYNAPEHVAPWVDPNVEPEPEPIPRDSIDIPIGEETEFDVDPDDPFAEPEPIPEPEPPVGPYETVVDRFQLMEGDYRFFTMNSDTTEIRYTNVSEYLDAPGDGMTVREILVSYVPHEAGDSTLRAQEPNFIDRNPAFDYIQPQFPPIYLDSVDMTRVDKDARQTVVFRPSKLTQNIDLYFTIVKDEQEVPFIIDSIRCELSGIAPRAGLFSGHLYLAHTYKMQFPARIEDRSGNERRDTTRTDSIIAHANIDVLGLVNNRGMDYQTGPGFLQVMVYAHASEMVNGEERVRRRMLQGIYNLHREIAAADLIEYDEWGQWARKRGDHAELRMERRMGINGRSVISGINGSEGNGGIDVWIESDEGHDVEL